VRKTFTDIRGEKIIPDTITDDQGNIYRRISKDVCVIEKQVIDELHGGNKFKDTNGKIWEKIKVKLDTGAVEWVFRKDVAEAFEITETPASVQGIPYYAANGTEIANYGQRRLAGYSSEWQPITACAQIAEVRSNLASGMKMIEADNRVILDKSGSYIENKRTGSRIRVDHENGAFTFDFWVPARRPDQGEPKVHSKPGQPKAPPRKTTPISNRFGPMTADEDDDMDIDHNGLNVVFVRQEDV